MGNYIVSARKYRPDTFESVVAQKSLTTTLKNAIHSGKLAHAYLFCGPRGVGKTTCARIFAKTINCQHPTADGEPCNQCESCLSFNQQRSYSIYELDAASNNSVDDIRSLNEQVRIPPQVGKYKVYIIDEVHMLTASAFNAFLKTLEEPPAHAIFILATTEKHKIIPTILSRCQIYDFSRIDSADIIAHLQSIAEKEGISTEYDALRIIAQKSDGCMRDALSLFDQMASFTQGELTYSKVIGSLNVLDYDYYFRVTDSVLEGKVSQALLLFNEILGKGFEGSVFIEGLAAHFRDLLVNGDSATASLFEGSEELRRRYAAQAARCSAKMIFKAIKLCNNCSMNYRASRSKRLLVELTLIELSQLSDDSGDDGGHGPKMLKPIFNKLQPADKHAAEVRAPQTESTNKVNTDAAVTVRTVETAVPEKEAPRQVAVHTGRPEQMQIRRSGLFGRSRAMSGTHEQGTVAESPAPQSAGSALANMPAENAAVSAAKATERPKAISQADLSQAWTSYALQLPENERALADRMKIITPNLTGENTFQISLDNQLVAELFTKESKRICDGMKAFLGNVMPIMKVEVNKVVVERHISDRKKQYEILIEKNPIIEKLRKELNLELAR
ncbi:MAG: DNA polymerase III subunit gamma/tau [Bacteroidaceae bacterium]|nr:DNA polymerase III subunit gamma/tau [Bacteroidaceae bacterium]